LNSYSYPQPAPQQIKPPLPKSAQIQEQRGVLCLHFKALYSVQCKSGGKRAHSTVLVLACTAMMDAPIVPYLFDLQECDRVACYGWFYSSNAIFRHSLHPRRSDRCCLNQQEFRVQSVCFVYILKLCIAHIGKREVGARLRKRWFPSMYNRTSTTGT